MSATCAQSNIPPMRFSWRVKFLMFAGMRSMGWTPCLSAKFSEWMPKASKPIGSKTCSPRRRRKRPCTSAPVKA